MKNFIALGVAMAIALYILYILVMRFKNKREDMGGKLGAWWIIAGPIVVAGYAVDVIFNVVFATILFMDAPRELTLTARLNDYYYRTGWRGKIARKLAPLINQHDPGHIG